MGWMDVTLAVILMVNGIRGWTRGLVLSLLQLLGFVMAWIAAKTYYQALANYIVNKTNLLSKIQIYISTRLKNADYELPLSGGRPHSGNVFEIIKLPKVLEELLATTASREYGTQVMDGFYHYMADIMGRLFIDFLSFFIIFIMVRIILTIIAHILNGFAKLPILRGLNQLGGAILGVVKGAIIVFLLMVLLIPFAAIPDQGVLKEGLEKSILTRTLYNHNPILYLIKGTTPEGSEL